MWRFALSKLSRRSTPKPHKEVYLYDGIFFSAEIIRQGYGFVYRRFPFKYLEEFRKSEREARRAERGLLGGLGERAQRWRCEPTARFGCSSAGCQALEFTVWVNLDFPARRYERCDSKGCDSYEMTYAVGGAFTTVTPLGARGFFLKAVNDGSEFLEVVSLGTAAHASFGRCTSP